MYELIILTALMRGPKHGYLIVRIINDTIGPFAKVSNGRLYPLLAKLQAAGLIALAPADARPERRQRPFHITDAGRQRFHQLMMDTTSNPGDYHNLFWTKAQYFEFLQPAEQRYLIDHYINYCQTHIFHLTSVMNNVAQVVPQKGCMNAAELEITLATMQHYQNRWRLELEQARNWRERYVASDETPEQPQEQASSSQQNHHQQDALSHRQTSA